MEHQYFYLVGLKGDRERSVWKIGKTKQTPHKRFRGSDYKGKDPIIVFQCIVENSDSFEHKVIKLFNEKFKLDHGREHFEGDVKEMITLIQKLWNDDLAKRNFDQIKEIEENCVALTEKIELTNIRKFFKLFDDSAKKVKLELYSFGLKSNNQIARSLATYLVRDFITDDVKNYAESKFVIKDLDLAQKLKFDFEKPVIVNFVNAHAILYYNNITKTEKFSIKHLIKKFKNSFVQELFNSKLLSCYLVSQKL